MKTDLEKPKADGDYIPSPCSALVDKYGNTEDRMQFCSYPDCGCDCARVCMAEEGASAAALTLNRELKSSLHNVEVSHGTKDQ